MINYLNFTANPMNGFENVNQLPSPLSTGLMVIFIDESSNIPFEQINIENTLVVDVSDQFGVTGPDIKAPWKMSIPETMTGHIISLIEAFYEHTYLPFEESKMLYSEAQQFRALFDTIPAVMYVKDTESRFVRVNDSFKKHVGLALDFDIVGKTDFDIFDEQHANQAFDDEQKIIKSGQAKAAYEEREVLPDGSICWALSTKIPMKDINNRIIGVSGVSFDITKIKISEQNAQQANRDLEKVNEELKHALKKS